MVPRFLKLFFIQFFLLLCANSFAQSESIIDKVTARSLTEAKVIIVQTESIKSLMEGHQFTKSQQPGITGYRIRIYSNSGPKSKAEYDQMMAKFSYAYSEVPVYPKFVYPNYKIYVGDFRSESEALKFRKQIELQFTEAFLVQTQINYPKLNLND